MFPFSGDSFFFFKGGEGGKQHFDLGKNTTSRFCKVRVFHACNLKSSNMIDVCSVQIDVFRSVF